MSEKRLFTNNYINWFFTSKLVDGFFFSILCATIFTFALCHWLLDLNYKYENLAQQGPIVDLTWVFWIGTIVALYYVIKQQQMQFDFALLILVQTMALIGVLDYHNENYVEVCYAWILPLSYIIGKLIATSAKRIYITYAVLTLGMFTCAFLDYSFIFGKYENWLYGEAWPTFFMPEAYLSRTTYDYGFVMIIAATTMAFVVFKRNKILSASILVLSIVPQIFSVKYHARLGTCLLAVCIGIAALIYIIENRKDKRVKTIVAITVVAIAALTIIAILLFKLNAFSFHDRYINSYWSDDGGVLKNVRFTMDWEAFKNIINYPLQDFQKEYGISRGHSMLLEYGRVYDVTIYGLLIAFRIAVIVDAIRFAVAKNIDIELKYLLVPAFASFNIYYSMEPNAHAHRYFLMAGLLLFGLIRGSLENKINEK